MTKSIAKEPNYDESKVPDYHLPDIMTFQDGRPVASPADWPVRRAEILDLFRREVYGGFPAGDVPVRFEVVRDGILMEDGAVVRREIRAEIGLGADAVYMNMLLFLPADRTGPVPVFTGLNFNGNHTVANDPTIPLPTAPLRSTDDNPTGIGREEDRGQSAARWPVRAITARGYGVMTCYCGDLDPDFDDGFQNGMHPLFYREGQERPAAHEWGTIGAWSWGLMRMLDYLQTDPDCDAERVIAIGHSRLGKTSLWAAANDTRFAMAVSNNSGCGGAALSRRCFGEVVERINRVFPHWFCRNFHQYGNAEATLPIDQHMLLALIAPRPLYVASATEDLWADPKGEFLSAVHAGVAYRLLGMEGCLSRTGRSRTRRWPGVSGITSARGRITLRCTIGNGIWILLIGICWHEVVQTSKKPATGCPVAGYAASEGARVLQKTTFIFSACSETPPSQKTSLA